MVGLGESIRIQAWHDMTVPKLVGIVRDRIGLFGFADTVAVKAVYGAGVEGALVDAIHTGCLSYRDNGATLVLNEPVRIVD